MFQFVVESDIFLEVSAKHVNFCLKRQQKCSERLQAGLCAHGCFSFAGSAPIGTRFSPDGCRNSPSAGLRTKIQEALKEGGWFGNSSLPSWGVSFRFSLFNDPIFFVSLTSLGRLPPLSSGFPAECRLVSANVNMQEPL